MDGAVTERLDALSQSGEDDGALLGQLLFDAARLGNLKSVDLEQALYDENEQFCRNYLLKD